LGRLAAKAVDNVKLAAIAVIAGAKNLLPLI
jgi:hypothetical protein